MQIGSEKLGGRFRAEKEERSGGIIVQTEGNV
jgi:hypothetical protein